MGEKQKLHTLLLILSALESQQYREQLYNRYYCNKHTRRDHPASLPSESGESLRHTIMMVATLSSIPKIHFVRKK